MAVTKQNLVDRYFQAGTIATVSLISFWPLGWIMEFLFTTKVEGAVLVLAVAWLTLSLTALFGLLYGFTYLFVRRDTDEFTLATWHAGTTTAFFSVIAWMLFGTIIQSLISSILIAMDPSGPEPEFNVIKGLSFPITLVAFLAGFHFKRFRG